MLPAPTTANAVRNRTIPAWAISACVHGLLLVGLILLLRSVPGGAADEPARTAGIVLKRISDEGELYEGEEETQAPANDSPVESTTEAQLAALPDQSAAPNVSEALPSLPAIGPGAVPDGGLPNAGELTRGAGGGRPQFAGGQARARMFGVEGVGTKFVYVIDRSTSMQDGLLLAAKKELIHSLESLESIHQFQIVFFNQHLRTFDLTDGQQRIAFATDRSKNLAAKFVGSMTADGGTNRPAAIKQALRLRPDVIFFLTDADDPMPAAEVAEVAAQNRRVGASINTIEFGHGLAHGRENFLVRLARDSGGQYAYVDTTRLGRTGSR